MSELAYRAESVAETEPDPGRVVSEREERKLGRSIEKRKKSKGEKGAPSEEEDLTRKLEIAANAAGPGPGSGEAEAAKDKIAVASLIKNTGRSEEDCAELLAMNRFDGVSTIQAYRLAHQMLLEDGGTAAMAGTGTGSVPGAGTGAGSGEPAYRAELVAEPEPDPEHTVSEREKRRNDRDVQRIEALKASKVKKVQIQKTAADTAGPGPGCINNTATGGKQDAQQAMEDNMENMCLITGCTEDQCAEAFATHSSPCRSTGEIWRVVHKSLRPDGASEPQGNPAQEFQG